MTALRSISLLVRRCRSVQVWDLQHPFLCVRLQHHSSCIVGSTFLNPQSLRHLIISMFLTKVVVHFHLPSRRRLIGGPSWLKRFCMVIPVESITASLSMAERCAIHVLDLERKVEWKGFRGKLRLSTLQIHSHLMNFRSATDSNLSNSY